MNHTILIDTIILLAAAVAVVPLFQYLKLGGGLGFLVAGLLIGPAGLELIDEVADVQRVGELGVVFLLFIIGIELKPSRLWLMRRMVFGLGSLQILLTGGMITLLVHLSGIELRQSLVLGLGLALSSTAFVLQILTEKHQLATNHGRTVFAVLLMQDLAVAPLLLLVPLLAMPETTIGSNLGLAMLKSAAILASVLLTGHFLLQPALHQVARHGSREIFLATGLLLVLGTALLVELAGMSMAMGAFVAGLLIANTEFRHQMMADIQPFRAILIGLFFMSVGMMLDLQRLFSDPLRMLLLLAALVSLKALLVWGIGRLFGVTATTLRRSALLLAQVGEFTFLLFSNAHHAGLFSSDLFQQATLVVALSMAITPLLGRIACHGGKEEDEAREELNAESSHLDDHPTVIIAGFGRMGQRIAVLMQHAGIRYAAIERRAWLVRKTRSEGFNVFYGEAENCELLRLAGVGQARLMVVAIDDEKVALELVTRVREEHPSLPIFARGHSRPGCDLLLRNGATNVASETLESSLQLSRFALETIGMPEEKSERLLEEYRRSYYRDINSKDPEPHPQTDTAPASTAIQ